MKPAKRFRILTRDGFKCRYCGRSSPDVQLHVDHATAKVNGGTNDDSNLVAACSDCNLGKGGTDATPPASSKIGCARCGAEPPEGRTYWLPPVPWDAEDYCIACCHAIEAEICG
jgi:hypothetical protein